MNIIITPGALSGRVLVPPSKSAAHRAMLCAALAGGESVLSPFDPVQDMLVTLEAIRALGAGTRLSGRELRVRGGMTPPACAEIDCVESGSTLRFLLPIVAALGIATRFLGSGRLPERPVDALIDALAAQGVTFLKGSMPSVSGRLRAGVFRLPGNVSSQYITGLLLALPLLEEDSEIVLTTRIESQGYVDLTVDILARFGVQVSETAEGYRIPGGQRYRPCRFTIEGDDSGAAFWHCANALGSAVEIDGLREDSIHADRAIVGILDGMTQTGSLCAVRADLSQAPDLLPALAVTAAFAAGESRLTGAARLRLKESDRLSAISTGLRALGAQVEERPDSLIITGQEILPGGCAVDSFSDHRIAMAMAIAALRCARPVTILDAQCVKKSYPTFWEDFQSLGGICDVV